MVSLHKIYDEIKGDDIVFVSISLDDTKDKWIKALESDNLPWIALHEGISGTKNKSGFFESVLRQKYGFNTIPFIVLIDKEGKTVKRSLRGEDVKKEIELLRKK